jgi:hypothetical protein
MWVARTGRVAKRQAHCGAAWGLWIVRVTTHAGQTHGHTLVPREICALFCDLGSRVDLRLPLPGHFYLDLPIKNSIMNDVSLKSFYWYYTSICVSAIGIA